MSTDQFLMKVKELGLLKFLHCCQQSIICDK